MIEINDLSYTVGKSRLLDHITMDLVPGKLHLIVGPNGAGKSTLVRAISGQLEIEKGHVKYSGSDLRSFSIAELAKLRAVMSQQIELPFSLRVEEVVLTGRYPHFKSFPGKTDIMACRETIALFGMQDFWDRDYLSLSGGEKQRVQFARVLAQIWATAPGEMRYLLLDEPLTHLDIGYQLIFMKWLSEFAKRNDVVVVGVVHDLQLASLFADNIYILKLGRLHAAGSPAEVITEANLSEVFGVEAKIVKAGEKVHVNYVIV